MGDKTYKTRKEHADGGREEVEREIGERRKYFDKSSAPKMRKLGDNEGYKEQRGTSGDSDGKKMEKRSLEDKEETAKEDMPKRRKTQTVMERYLVGMMDECHVDSCV